MFYRRKIILSVLELINKPVEKIQLQKLLFLVSKRIEKSPYDFIPYKFGCYSFSLKADLDTMTRKKQLEEVDNFYLLEEKTDFLSSLRSEDTDSIKKTVSTFGGMDKNELIKYTYRNYPFYASRSSIADEILNQNEYKKILKTKTSQNNTILFTIGYEGISLEKYLLKLIENNVKLLVDVRKNPISMKFGFNKSKLKWVCNSLGIDYLHLPEVGIESNKRTHLNRQEDYEILFDDYKTSVLAKTVKIQQQILQLLKQNNRIALTCFEAETSKCHRTHLANAVSSLSKTSYPLKHL